MDNGIGIFLDRDGVINEDKNLVKTVSEFQIYDKAADAIKILKQFGPVIIVTNQPQIARGMITEAEVSEINNFMIKELATKGAFIDAIYYCPHHPEMHPDTPEWARKYRVECSCRKPKTGMLEKAAEDFSLDLKKSFMVGDQTRDILAGKTAGCRTILVRTGQGGNDGKYPVSPDYVSNDIYDAALLVKDIMKK